jgi:hypothetical protein
MRTASRLGLVVSSLLVVATASRAIPPGEADPTLHADIVKLMELTGSADLGKEMASLVADAALESFKGLHPQLPTRAYLVAHDVLQSEYARGFSEPEGFLATVIPIYEKHFSHAEIKALIAFYEPTWDARTSLSSPHSSKSTKNWVNSGRSK